jgi:polysaccharide biosynthesis/export protein VpsN
LALRILIKILLLLSLFCSLGAYADDESLKIGVGDVLSIVVYNEADLTVRAKVGQSGRLSVPLIGDILVVNKTTQQLSNELEVAFKNGYLVHPSVSVIVEAYRPFYIKGAVKAAGAYEFVLGLTLDQAIAIAGGLKDRASKDKWYILRGVERKKIKAKKNSKVYPGDIITIEESIF